MAVSRQRLRPPPPPPPPHHLLLLPLLILMIQIDFKELDQAHLIMNVIWYSSYTRSTLVFLFTILFGRIFEMQVNGGGGSNAGKQRVEKLLSMTGSLSSAFASGKQRYL